MRTRRDGHGHAGCDARGRSLTLGPYRCDRCGAPRRGRVLGRRRLRGLDGPRCRRSTSCTWRAGSPSSCGARRRGTPGVVRPPRRSAPAQRRRDGGGSRLRIRSSSSASVASTSSPAIWSTDRLARPEMSSRSWVFMHPNVRRGCDIVAHATENSVRGRPRLARRGHRCSASGTAQSSNVATSSYPNR
jgi:hypothetical protein